MSISIKQILSQSLKKLKSKNITSADLDAEVLLSHSLKKPREFLYAHPEYKISKNAETEYFACIERRLENEPVAYITGSKEFCGLKFYVNKNVLIPRPESEMLVEQASQNLVVQLFLQKGLGNQVLTIIDIGTGSGCIIISLLKKILRILTIVNIRSIKFLATDISAQALKVARKNAKLHKVNKKITFLQGNLLEPVKLKPYSHLIILANLPYISKKEYSRLQPEIIKYEPKIAVTDNADGLKLYQELFEQIQQLTKAESLTLILEHAPKQMKKLGLLAKKYFPKSKIKIKKDLHGLERMMILRL